MKNRLLLTSLLLLIGTYTHAQIQTRKLDSLFNNLEQRGLAFGSALIIQDNTADGGSLLYTRSVGYSRLEPKKSSTRETQYKIGSVSKMITAVMIFQLIEEKKLTLDQTLSTYFPEIPNAGKITIAHLLSHRSGLHDYTNNTNFESWMATPQTHEQLIKLISEKGSDFDPGSKAAYCNSNYLLLSYILEKITSMSYEKNLSVRITSKIKTWPRTIGQDQDNRSISYKYANNSWKAVTETYPGIHSGAGDIITTPSGLGAFIHMLFNDHFIQKSSLEKMTVMTDGYGLGIFPYDHGSVKGYGHNGRMEEFYTAVRYFPEEKLTVVYCTNGINYPRADILEFLIKAGFNESFDVPFTTKPFAQLKQFTGIYAADQLPTVVVSVIDNKLIAETQGVKFELEAVSKNYFMHTPTGYYFDFAPDEQAVRIKETDNVYFLKKK